MSRDLMTGEQAGLQLKKVKSKPKTTQLYAKRCLFPLSAGEDLRIRKTLLETLAIDKSLLEMTNPGVPRSRLRLFVQGVEQAWLVSRYKIQNRQPNLILWLRGLLKECHQAGLWIPSICIRRLRQLERGELGVRDRHGRLELPRFEGLPSVFVEACEFMGWGPMGIVPRYDGTYGNAWKVDKDEIEFVQIVCHKWKGRPRTMKRAELCAWFIAEVGEAGWTVNH
ncbi:MAG TPA: hypothetical protein VGR03_06055 [Candidatus Acidoferrum sp.]|nr:hypothetical protein [Candidatus Acidoferrum sp.]